LIVSSFSLLVAWSFSSLRRQIAEARASRTKPGIFPGIKDLYASIEFFR